MRKKLIWRLLVSSVMVLIVSVATPDLNAKPVKAGGLKHRTVTIPKHAIEVVPGKMFWLGTAIEKGRLVEGYAIIHHKKGFAKPSECVDDGNCKGWEDQSCPDCQGGGVTEPSTCYGFLANGAKWNVKEPYIVDPTNNPPDGKRLDNTTIRSKIAASIDKWDQLAGDVIGNEVSGVVDGIDLISPDGKNEVLFGDAPPGAIAMTVVWGVFRGPPFARGLVEWDQVYDEVDFNWSFTGDSGTMDFESIVTHELGHTFGLDDQYQDSCIHVTMYGYASEGETNKRVLENEDIAGILELYN
jgi:hypothetical protein